MRPALFIVLPLMFASASATPPVEKPPAPAIDLGDWDKPSKPIWMETELQRPKIKAINHAECFAPALRAAGASRTCPIEVGASYDVDDTGQAINIRTIRAIPEGQLVATLAGAIQCLKFPPYEEGDDRLARAELESWLTKKCGE